MRTRIVLSLFASCLAFSAALAQSSVTAGDLQHHRWVLESIDGEALLQAEGGRVPEIDFGEQMRVAGNTGCNQFNGQGVLRDGNFLIEAMAVTRMMCAPPWSDIELKVETILSSESSISIDDDRKLTLASANGTLVFIPSDLSLIHI